MKRLIALLLALVMSLSLVACGSEAAPAEDPTEGQAAEKPAAEEPASDNPVSEEASAAEEPVTITIPADFLEAEDTDELMGDEYAAYFESITKNEDGSFTCVIMPERQQALLSVLGQELQDELKDEIPDDDYPSIKSVEVSEDFTKATLIVDYDAYESSFDGLAIYLPIFTCGTYQTFAGQGGDALSVTVTIQDEETGHIEDVIYYPDDFESGGDEALAEDLSYTVEEAPNGILISLTNNGDSEVELCSVTVTFYTEEGYEAGSGYADFSMIQPETTAREAVLNYTDHPFATYEITLDTSGTYGGAADRSGDLAITDTHSAEDGRVEVTITNTGTEFVDFYDVACVFYDENDQIVFLDTIPLGDLVAQTSETWAFTDPYDVETGESIPYDHYEVILCDAYSHLD